MTCLIFKNTKTIDTINRIRNLATNALLFTVGIKLLGIKPLGIDPHTLKTME